MTARPGIETVGRSRRRIGPMGPTPRKGASPLDPRSIFLFFILRVKTKKYKRGVQARPADFRGGARSLPGAGSARGLDPLVLRELVGL
jgi:hypothetical protein